MNKELLRQLGFIKEVDAFEQKNCTTCGLPLKDQKFKDKLSIVEAKISGMCQKCQDEIFG